MKAGISCALCFVAVTVVMRDDPRLVVLAAQGAPQAAATPSPSIGATPAAEANRLGRFLSDAELQFQSLVSYRALRRMSVVARGGKMTATLTARTTLDPVNGFQFEVLEENGSGMLRSRVLHGVLEAESEAKRREKGAHGALTPANYSFDAGQLTPEGLLRVGIHPRRKDNLLMDGSIYLTEAADLVRMEGLLVKRPSFWTRKVMIVRDYARIAGVRVPINTSSTADILFAGQSTFNVSYEYESINEIPIHPAAIVPAAQR